MGDYVNWKDFKAAVDAKIIEQGQTEDIEISWIDVSYLYTPNSIDLVIDESGPTPKLEVTSF